jgi:1-acyl-sn-glycerol-3-phosphate acyltransferase
MMRASRQIPVARNINSFFAAMDEVRKRLREQNIVHVFPEMTRCEPRMAGTQNFSALPFAIAIQEKVLILPVVFRDTDATWPKNRFGLCFRKPVQAWTLAPVDAAQFTSSEELRTSVRRLITEALNNPPLPQEGAR